MARTVRQEEGAQTPLLDRMRAHIRAKGPIRLDRFMVWALQDPEQGYYRRAQAIGRAGDFITAPEISQVFGELVGLWLADRWQAMGRPAPVNLVELGPGRGTLMADIWRACGVVPGFHEAARIHLVETNRRLRRLQRRLIPRASWHEHIDDLPPGPMLLVANEFFDALPVRQFLFTAGGWRERAVGLTADGRALAWTDLPVRRAVLERLVAEELRAQARPGDIVEVSPAVWETARALAGRLARAGGAALIIDYGYEGPAVGETLQAVYRHRPADPLLRPGAQDLSAHVDFAVLTRAARGAGLSVFGPTGQGPFLLALGLAVRLQRLLAGKPARLAADLYRAAERLVAPGAMGALFKVMAWTDRDACPPGFAPPSSGP